MEKRVKICILSSVHPALDTRIFYKEARSLVRAGYDVTLIAQYDRNETLDDVKIIALSKPRNRFFRIFGLTQKVFWLAKNQKADIYHFHDPELMLVGIILKIFNRRKVIYDIHEDYSEKLLSKEWIPSIFRNWLGKKLFEIGERFFSKAFDHLILTTESAAEKFKGFKEKITVIHNFPMLELCRINPSSEKKYDVIIAGSISRDHLLTIIKIGNSLKKLKSDFKWCIIGAPLDLINLGKTEIQQLGLEKNFQFIPRIPHHQVIQYLTQSKIGFIHLFPEKRFERMLPTKLFEYMACGLPVVSSELPLIHEFTDSYQCVIQLSSGDIQGFANAISYLLSHPKEADQMGKRGKKATFQNYNWSKEEIKLINLYRNL